MAKNSNSGFGALIQLCARGQSLHGKQYSIDTASLVYIAVTIADNCGAV